MLEETGYDIQGMIDPTHFIEARDVHEKMQKLFIVTGVDPNTAAFAPQMAGVGGEGGHR